jgi:hypothetical protein
MAAIRPCSDSRARARPHPLAQSCGSCQSAELTVRGVDAPKEPLQAGVEGKWSAGADESGVSLSQLDDVNEWREITHGQMPARAYELARKVWDRVKAARTRIEASDIPTAASCKLHGYCGLN